MTQSITPTPKVAVAAALWGILGVIIFSLTLPATKLAIESFDPLVVGFGRNIPAAFLAALALCFTGQKCPTKKQFVRISIIALGMAIGFPTLTAWAMQHVPASHGAIALGLIPLATAIIAVIRAKERPSVIFWVASFSGALSVTVYAMSTGGGAFVPADLALIGAILCAAIGNAEGGLLSREIGSWQVICWAVVVAALLAIIPVAIHLNKATIEVNSYSLGGLVYLCIFSALLGFFAWYHALAIGGVAKISQLQLFQPFFTLLFCSIFLDDVLSLTAAAAVICVAISVFIGFKSRYAVKQEAPQTPAG